MQKCVSAVVFARQHPIAKLQRSARSSSPGAQLGLARCHRRVCRHQVRNCALTTNFSLFDSFCFGLCDAHHCLSFHHDQYVRVLPKNDLFSHFQCFTFTRSSFVLSRSNQAKIARLQSEKQQSLLAIIELLEHDLRQHADTPLMNDDSLGTRIPD